MSEHPTSGQAAEVTRAVYTGDEPNPILHFLQRPRIVLILLAAWSVMTVLAEIYTKTDVLINQGGNEINGVFGGLAFGWQGIPLAAVYIYSLRDPVKHRPVYWLGLIHMGSLSASMLFHAISGPVGWPSIFAPLPISVGLGVLCFLHLFAPKEHPETVVSTPD
ncbi:MAG: hypothetical protein ABI559_00825 [Chloroflexota bacterium]